MTSSQLTTSPTARRSSISIHDLISPSSPLPALPTLPTLPPPPPQHPQTPKLTSLHTPHLSTTTTPDHSFSSADLSPRHQSYTPHLSMLHTLSSPIRKTTTTRGPWRIEEDRLLIKLVHKCGPRNWAFIATYFPNRTGKQARERWINQLNPSLKKKNWTAEEDTAILTAHASLGNKWSIIAHTLPGRTDNSVKNRYNSTLRRAFRERNNPTIRDIVHSLHAPRYIDYHSGHYHSPHYHSAHYHSAHLQHPPTHIHATPETSPMDPSHISTLTLPATAYRMSSHVGAHDSHPQSKTMPITSHVASHVASHVTLPGIHSLTTHSFVPNRVQ